MRKNVKRFIVLLLVFIFSLSAAGCGGKTEESADSKFEGKNPFKLKVFNFDGGYGTKWLNSLEERYEAERMGKEFTVNGVTYDSVDVKIEAVKSTMESMATNFSSTNHVYFHEFVNYASYINDNKILEDMTEVLKTENPYEKGTTLESKLTDEQKAYYSINGKYYGIPHYAAYTGLIYNTKMFDDNGFYLKDGYTYNGNNLAACFTENKDDRSAGPDGVTGTADDGLPATYSEFFMLCGYISATDGCVPIEWAGKYRQEYLNWFLTSLVASYEGLEQMSLNYSFNGVAKNLVSVSNGKVTNIQDTTINGADNGYELAKQAGKYYGLSFLENIVDNNWYASNSFLGTYEQTYAQRDFIEGAAKQPAMLIDGVWWEMEANSSFVKMSQKENENYKNRYAMMPIPCATEEKAQERAEALQNGKNGYTLVDLHNSLCFIGKGISADEKKIAVDFIQYAYTDASLSDFSKITDTTKAVKYTMSESDKSEMSTFGRSLFDLQGKSDIVYGHSQTQFFRNNETSFTDYKTLYNSVLTGGGVAESIAVDKFKSGVSAETYFNGLYTRQLKMWSENIVK